MEEFLVVFIFEGEEVLVIEDLRVLVGNDVGDLVVMDGEDDGGWYGGVEEG